MNIISLIIFFLLGIIMGEFFNVVAMRLSLDEEKLFTRSHCDVCYHKLRFFEIIPIFSYLFLKGKCRYCKKNIKISHLIVELLTGILFAFTYYMFGFSYELLIGLGIISIFVIVCVSDMSYLIIPDEVLIFFGGYFIIIQYFRIGLIQTVEHIFIGVLLFLVMYTIMLIGDNIFKKESLGGGDIKLMIIFGLLLDPLMGVITIFLASILALPISLLYMRRSKDHVIPFGPFLLLALTIIYFTGINTEIVLSWLAF